MTCGYVYAILIKNCIFSKKHIFKVGRTQDIITRYKSYPKSSQLLFVYYVKNCIKTERILINSLKSSVAFRHRTDYGSEYFEGAFAELSSMYKKCVIELSSEHNISQLPQEHAKRFFYCPRCNFETDRRFNLKTHFHKKKRCQNINNVELTDKLMREAMKEKDDSHGVIPNETSVVATINSTSHLEHSSKNNINSNDTIGSNNNSSTHINQVIENPIIVCIDPIKEYTIHDIEMCTPIMQKYKALIELFELDGVKLNDLKSRRYHTIKKHTKQLYDYIPDSTNNATFVMPDKKDILYTIQSFTNICRESEISFKMTIKHLTAFLDGDTDDVYYADRHWKCVTMNSWCDILKKEISNYLKALQFFCIHLNQKSYIVHPRMYERSRQQMYKLFRTFHLLKLPLFFKDKNAFDVIKEYYTFADDDKFMQYEDEFTHHDAINDCKEMYNKAEYDCRESDVIQFENAFRYLQEKTLGCSSDKINKIFSYYLHQNPSFMNTMKTQNNLLKQTTVHLHTTNIDTPLEERSDEEFIRSNYNTRFMQ